VVIVEEIVEGIVVIVLEIVDVEIAKIVLLIVVIVPILIVIVTMDHAEIFVNNVFLDHLKMKQEFVDL
jgi:hypothetical protein